MSKEKQIDIILEEIDEAYTIPTYMEKRALRNWARFWDVLNQKAIS